jgi:hypothetical protein
MLHQENSKSFPAWSSPAWSSIKSPENPTEHSCSDSVKQIIVKVVSCRALTLLGRNGSRAIGQMTMAQAIAIADPFQRVMG